MELGCWSFDRNLTLIVQPKSNGHLKFNDGYKSDGNEKQEFLMGGCSGKGLFFLSPAMQCSDKVSVILLVNGS